MRSSKTQLNVLKNTNCTATSKAFLLLFLCYFILLPGGKLAAQTTRKVLFLGNSYTAANSLPQLVHDVALSVGDTLIFDSNTPGGYQLISHAADVTSQNKIMTGAWDYVVLQGQSQEPVTQFGTFSSGGTQLNNLINQYTPCSVVMLYMTWGRKNGDVTNCANYPVMCTYIGMDSTLKNNYKKLAKSLNAEVSPVSVVWRNIRQNYPSIQLYDSDESHPAIAGSYAAACCFYACLFKKDPSLISFNSSLNPTDAAAIRSAVKTEVFDNLAAWDFKDLPTSNFSYYIGSGLNEVIFNALPNNTAEKYLWDFGDGSTSTLTNPIHSYLANGTFTVSLTTTNCDLQGMHTSISDTVIQFCNHTPSIYSTQTWLCLNDTLWTQAATSYQWFVNGQTIPETNQYLAHYYQYANGAGISVLSTVNGCAELSEASTKTPEWSGYYFDVLPIADPCIGDTVAFAVLHINGFLSGAEIIQWYKNDTLLTAMANADTLLISSAGKYECKVVDPNSNCPTDTTSYTMVFTCGTIGIKEKEEAIAWNIFPNPSAETITLKVKDSKKKEQIQIYAANGRLKRTMEITGETTFSIADLPDGMYFIRLKKNSMNPIKFIKQKK